MVLGVQGGNMYLNIVLTLILLVFTGNLYANVNYGFRAENEQKKVIDEQTKRFNKSLANSNLMLEELRKLNNNIKWRG